MGTKQLDAADALAMAQTGSSFLATCEAAQLPAATQAEVLTGLEEHGAPQQLLTDRIDDHGADDGHRDRRSDRTTVRQQFGADSARDRHDQPGGIDSRWRGARR